MPAHTAEVGSHGRAAAFGMVMVERDHVIDVAALRGDGAPGEPAVPVAVTDQLDQRVRGGVAQHRRIGPWIGGLETQPQGRRGRWLVGALLVGALLVGALLVGALLVGGRRGDQAGVAAPPQVHGGPVEGQQPLPGGVRREVSNGVGVDHTEAAQGPGQI